MESICCWLPREEAETNENYKQVIPYCAVVRSDGHYLIYRRKGNEKRLHGLISMGVGGHIDGGESLLEGLHREIREEADPESFHYKFLGIVNMHNSPVDKVHVGLMYKVYVDYAKPKEELREPEWVALSGARLLRDEMEPWSRYLLDELVHPF